MSAKEKDPKKKEDLKSFTVGSVRAGAPKAKTAKAPAAVKVEIKERDFPTLVNLHRSKDLKPFEQEIQRVLIGVGEAMKGGGSQEKQDVEAVQKAYALALAVLENSKIVR